MGKAYLGLSEEWSHELQRRRVSSKMEYVFVCNQRGQTHLRNSRCELELTVKMSPAPSSIRMVSGSADRSDSGVD